MDDEQHEVRDARRARVLAEGLGASGVPDLATLREFVPAEWVSRTSVGLDGVLRTSMPTAGTPLPDEVTGALEPVAAALARQEMAGAEAVTAIEAAHRLGALAEAAELHAARELAARTGEEQLKLKDVADPAELSRTARERWRGRCKTLPAVEISALTGAGSGTARERVAIALAPEVSRRAVDQALTAGIARMDLVAAWWRRCARMPHEQGDAVARVLFATDAPPEEVAVERLTPEGEVSTAPWAKKEFYRALEREALAQEGTDPEAQERDRQARHERRDAWAELDDDGSARMVVTGDALSITAAMERIAGMADRARKAGDQRTEAQLRSDLARMLLLHGVPRLPDLGDETALITPHDVEKLADVLAGLPAHELQVVVPWDVLTGTAALHGPVVNPAPGLGADGGPGVGDDGGPTTPAGPGQPPGPSGGQVRAGVGEILGRYGRFLSAAEVRRIAGRPGTTIYRLLTDVADGRCLERSIAAYQPDAAMRAQLRAADVTSRAPGSTTAAAACQLDHVIEYLLAGPTGERNLQTLDVPFHALKTEKFWDAEMDASRNVTWTSFWGRIYRTRPHDYRQYFSRIVGARPPGADGGPAGGGPSDDGRELLDRRHLASLLVYSALAHRDPGARLEADDDDPEARPPLHGLRDAVVLRRTTASGRRTAGVRPGTPTPEELLAADPQVVLDAQDWVEAVARATARGAAEERQHDADHREDDTGPAQAGDTDGTPDPPPPF